ncbi:MAG: hypothetical protein ABC595_07970 [Candidatus Methanosuratincola petrocarbonis]
MVSNSLNWTNWLKFKNIWVRNGSKYFFQSKENLLIPEDPGVYQVRCIQKNDKPIQIQRANGVDTEGILYIGSSSDLMERIRTFWRGVNENVPPNLLQASISSANMSQIYNLLKVPHSGANTYAIFQFAGVFPQDSLEVQWAQTSTYKSDETTLLYAYMAKFLDKPPLNLSIKRW